jgi:hypothetical protein
MDISKNNILQNEPPTGFCTDNYRFGKRDLLDCMDHFSSFPTGNRQTLRENPVLRIRISIVFQDPDPQALTA